MTERDYRKEAEELINIVSKLQEQVRNALKKNIEAPAEFTEKEGRDFSNAYIELNKIDPDHFVQDVLTVPFAETEVYLSLPKNKKRRQEIDEKIKRARDAHNLFIVASALINDWLKPLSK